LASLASEGTGSVFTSRCNLLKKIVSAWERGEECEIKNSKFKTLQNEQSNYLLFLDLCDNQDANEVNELGL
jgi:hypothetical protein